MTHSLTPVDVYEAHMVPAMFSQWADHMVDTLDLEAGCRVLDLACGTGIVARRVREHLSGRGRVAGLDLNPRMLERAQAIETNVEWFEGDATTLPFSDGEFDVVVCQQGLQFFPEPVFALEEAPRVLDGPGILATSTWCELSSSPGHAALTDALQTHVGAGVGEMMRSVFGLGDLDHLGRLFADAGFTDVKITRERGRARFESADAFARYVIIGSVLGRSGVEVSEATLRAICADVSSALSDFERGGTLEFPMEAHVTLAHKGR